MAAVVDVPDEGGGVDRARGKPLAGSGSGAAAPHPGPFPGGGGSPPPVARRVRLFYDPTAVVPPRPERVGGSIPWCSRFACEVLP